MSVVKAACWFMWRRPSSVSWIPVPVFDLPVGLAMLQVEFIDLDGDDHPQKSGRLDSESNVCTVKKCVQDEKG
jgi:hypothetical protein